MKKKLYICVECRKSFELDDLYTCETCNTRFCEDCLESKEELLDSDGLCCDCR